MKLNKTMFMMCMAILGIFTIAQLSYAYTMMVNLGQSTEGPDVTGKVEATVDSTQKQIDEIKTKLNNLGRPDLAGNEEALSILVDRFTDKITTQQAKELFVAKNLKEDGIFAGLFGPPAAITADTGKQSPAPASSQTLFEAKPALFAENMVGTISLPASEFQADNAVRGLANFITAGAEGKNVIILGETEEQVDLVKNKLGQILRLEGIEGERLFFAITTNESIISAVRELFTIKVGIFRLCTGDNLAPAVREALKGAV